MNEVVQAAKTRGFPAPLFIHRASVEAADGFFANRAPDARRISDPDGELFAAFGLERGSLRQLMGPSVWWRGFKALLKGNLVGRPTGDLAQMPGAFLVQGNEIVWHHRARHSADHPDLAALLPGGTKGRAAIGKLQAEHRKLLEQARDRQRNGDLRGYATLLERAEELGKQIDDLEEQHS